MSKDKKKVITDFFAVI